eukprot:scaffold593_cov73-Cyclotella_meneghiniana.AAC.4
MAKRVFNSFYGRYPMLCSPVHHTPAKSTTSLLADFDNEELQQHLAAAPVNTAAIHLGSRSKSSSPQPPTAA